jgi:lipopolysaccharide export system ATP-binding protein
MGMGYLPQEESIFRKLTVEQNILAILEMLPGKRREKKQRCEQLLRQFGIENLAKNQALTLSGGEKRRLTIARSLVTNPQMIMLDEPFSGVDPIAVAEIQQHISNLRSSGLSILITDHNVRETLEIVDRAYLVYDETSQTVAGQFQTHQRLTCDIAQVPSLERLIPAKQQTRKGSHAD